jgi:VanZ family protein
VLNKFWKYNIIWIAWLCLITYLSNSNSSGIPLINFLNFKGADKIVHAVFYFNLMILMSWGFRKQHYFFKLQANYLRIPFFFCIAWGGFMEILQLTIFTYRSAEWLDFFANTTGALLAIIIINGLWNSKKNS